MYQQLRRGTAAALSILTFALTQMPSTHAQNSDAVVSLLDTNRGAWSAKVTYAENDLVMARGSSWRAKQASKGKMPGSTNPNNAAYWQVVAQGFNPLGRWRSAATYQPNDVVTFQGQAWRAKLTNHGSQPAVNATWELFSARGRTGEQERQEQQVHED